MNKEEYLLQIVSEEAAEVSQAVSKAMRFGKLNFHPLNRDETNEDNLLTEFYQLQAMIEHMQEIGMLKTQPDCKIKEIKCRKLEKVYAYMEESKRQGTLIDDSEEILRVKADAYDELNRLYDGVDYYDDDTAKTFSRSACDVFCKVEDFEKSMRKEDNADK